MQQQLFSLAPKGHLQSASAAAAAARERSHCPTPDHGQRKPLKGHPKSPPPHLGQDKRSLVDVLFSLNLFEGNGRKHLNKDFIATYMIICINL